MTSEAWRMSDHNEVKVEMGLGTARACKWPNAVRIKGAAMRIVAAAADVDGSQGASQPDRYCGCGSSRHACPLMIIL